MKTRQGSLTDFGVKRLRPEGGEILETPTGNSERETSAAVVSEIPGPCAAVVSEIPGPCAAVGSGVSNFRHVANSGDKGRVTSRFGDRLSKFGDKSFDFSIN